MIGGGSVMVTMGAGVGMVMGVTVEYYAGVGGCAVTVEGRWVVS